MLIHVPVLTCEPLCILSSRKSPKCRIRVLFNKEPELPDACPVLNLSIFLRFNHSLYTPITHIFLFQVNKGSELMWKYFIYFWLMLRTGTFKVVLQVTTRLNSFKGPDKLWLLSSTSVSRRKTWQNKVKQKLSCAYVQNYIEKCVRVWEYSFVFYYIFFSFTLLFPLVVKTNWFSDQSCVLVPFLSFGRYLDGVIQYPFSAYLQCDKVWMLCCKYHNNRLAEK